MKKKKLLTSILLLLLPLVAIAAPAQATTADQITIKFKGRSGIEDVRLKINGQTKKTWYNVGKNWTTVTYNSSTPIDIDDIKVHLLDGTKKGNKEQDLTVDYLKVFDTTYQSESATTKSKGSWSSSNGCGQGYKQSQTLHCQGWFKYDVPVGTSIGNSLLTLHEFESNVLGSYTQTDLEADFGTAVKFPGSTYDDQNQTTIATDPANPSNQTLAHNLYYNPTAGETPWEGTFKAPITPTNELTLEYDVKFDDPNAIPEFGKLWGICGKGTHWDCPGGGNNTDGTRGTSHRVTWDARGTCTIYAYHGQMTYPFGQHTPCFPNDPNPPQLTDGNWHNIKLHVKLNTITNGTPNPDGEVKLYLDGQLAAQQTNQTMVHINSPLQYIWNSSMQKQQNNPHQQTIHYDNIKTY